MEPTQPPSPETVRLLRDAISELRDQPNDLTMSRRFERVHDLADALDELTSKLLAGDLEAGLQLYIEFAPTSSWDDVGGSQQRGNELCEALRQYWKP